MFRIVSCFLLFIAPALLANSLTTTQVQETLALQFSTEANGTFVQKKYFAALKKPFISEGQFRVSGTEFDWLTKKPVNSALFIRGNRIFSEDNIGNQVEISGAKPVVELLKAVTTGHLETIATQFGFFQTEQQQCVLLTPKAKSLSDVIAQIQLCGRGVVSDISVLEISGNKTEIQLLYNRD
ncbi:outer-membrane lipoprotein carrier protein LolA [Thalassotalea litorea]|uniref:outer-membrane lipoprotein carrier protein LolA n=1 Tax=Thalassotalea litorea TaxID=2020715 RepID=UPI003735D09B